MISIIKKNKILTFAILLYIFLLVFSPGDFINSAKNTSYYFKEMLQILPVVFLLTALIEAWVPKETIINGFGENSGARGILFSFLLGSFSAGPIYAAFPVCKMLLKKGASIFNIVIILSSWAVIKIPMLANEAKFLGIKFMISRWILTVLAILVLALAVKLIVKKEDLDNKSEEDDTLLIYESDYCIGCSLCSKIEPRVFYMEGKKARVSIQGTIEDYIESLLKVEESCPARAIRVNQ